MNQVKDVATIVIVNDQQILVLKRGPNSSGSGLWNFPGGSVEKNEEFDLAAIRELKEEANLDVRVENIYYLGTKETKYLHIHTYITNTFSGDVKINKESTEYKWVSLEELSTLPFVGGGTLHSKILNAIQEFMEKDELRRN